MKHLKSNFIALLAFVLPVFAWGQAAFLEKPEEFKPDKPCKIIVNLKLTSNEWGIVEAANNEDMFLWVWKPAEHPAGHPFANGIGGAAWKNSNDALKMTKESDGVYSYSFTPTEFFEVEAATVFKEDFHFLVKPKDGGGYGDPDIKTEDLTISVDPPASPIVKVQSVPQGKGKKLDTIASSTADVFSIVYNNNVEEKASMQEAEELYVYIVAYDDLGNEYKIASSPKRVADFPELKMTKNTDGIFQFSCIPDRFISIPDGQMLYRLEVQIVKPNLRTTSDWVDGVFTYYFNQGGC